MCETDYEYCHYVFSTRDRAPVFGSPELEDALREIICRVAIEKGFDLEELAVMPDHVHLLIRRKLTDSHTYIMKSIKGISARRLFEFEPDLKYDLRADRLWARGYYVRPVPLDKVNIARRYIQNQKLALYGSNDALYDG